MPEPADWIGRTAMATDPMWPWPARALIATLELDRTSPTTGDPLPPFWHWMHFLEVAPRSALGPDGHLATGGFMPAVRQPRRMWAGGRLTFHAPLPLGTPAEKTATIAKVEEKQGSTGGLTFVTVRHQIRSGGTLCVTEDQDIVYREDPDPDTPRPQPPEAPSDETHGRDWQLDTTVLFRYSALTFNGHRIHYDLPQARAEGYDGLVVHGPLLATLLLELGHQIGVHPRRFDFRATAPVLEGERFRCSARRAGDGLDLWVTRADGGLAMQARIQSGAEPSGT